MPIRTRATIAAAIFLIMGSIFMSFLSYESQKNNLIAESRRKIEVALSMLAEMSSTPLSQGDTLALTELADRAARGQPGQICFADRSGLILADSLHRSYDSTNKVIQTARTSLKSAIKRSGDLWEAAKPVIDQSGRLTGIAYVTFPAAPLEQALHKTAVTVTAFSLLMVALGVIVAYYLGRYLSLLFAPLITAIRQTAAGKLDTRIERSGVSELDEIAHAFNHMAQLVGDRVNQLETFNLMAMKLSASRTVEEFAGMMQEACHELVGGDCRLFLGDPRGGFLRLVGDPYALRHVTPDSIALGVANTGRSVAIGNGGAYAGGSQVVEGYKPERAVITPLRAPDIGIIGLMAADFTGKAVALAHSDILPSIEAISRLIAPLLAAVQRNQAQERATEALRDMLLPESPPDPEGLEVATLYEPAEKSSGFGGDYYDLLQLDDGIWGFAIGDVSGKGLAAGRYTAMVKYAVRSFILEYGAPAEAIKHANSVLTAQMEEAIFLTMFLGVLNVKSRSMVYCCAGHLPGLLYSRDTEAVRELPMGGMAMGLMGDATYNEGSVEIGGGDMLVLYTDGLIEARRNGEFYGTERLRSTVRRVANGGLREAASMIIEDVRNFASDGLRDDIALLLIRLQG